MESVPFFQESSMFDPPLTNSTGPMILAPFAEAPPIGRLPVYMSTLLVFIFFNFGIIYA
jgi:hypothetical protein